MMDGEFEYVKFDNYVSPIYPDQAVIQVLRQIQTEITRNIESIIGTYNASTPEKDRPSYKIERNAGRQECLDIIERKIKEIDG